jgi:hypothetical protein
MTAISGGIASTDGTREYKELCFGKNKSSYNG